MAMKVNKISKIPRILPVFSVLLCCSCNTDKRTDYEAYKDILDECVADRDFHTQLYIFPQSIEGLEITNFYYSNTTDLFTGSWLMYLGIKWDQDGFNNELLRLNNVKAVYNTGLEKLAIKYEDQHMFLTIKKDNRYEYALYNNDTFEIVYVSNQLYAWDKTPVKTEHILPDVTIPKELDDGGNTYNIYYRYEGEVGWEVID